MINMLSPVRTRQRLLLFYQGGLSATGQRLDREILPMRTSQEMSRLWSFSTRLRKCFSALLFDLFAC